MSNIAGRDIKVDTFMGGLMEIRWYEITYYFKDGRRLVKQMALSSKEVDKMKGLILAGECYLQDEHVIEPSDIERLTFELIPFEELSEEEKWVYGLDKK